MKILLIKMSSLGDVIHTLPALTDAQNAIPEIEFHWVIEERFQSVARWHPAVSKVFPIALRRWRKSWFSKKTRAEEKAFKENIQHEHYDLVIDAQGLLKSALVARMVNAEKSGYSFKSAREPLASLFYQKRFRVSWRLHAIERIRFLFSKALYYPYPESDPDGGVCLDDGGEKNYLLFFHGTTWENKHWPEKYWVRLAEIALRHGYRVRLAWGSKEELARCERIKQATMKSEVIDDCDIDGIAKEISGARAVVAVDTGLGHLAAALKIPTFVLFGPTDPERNGVLGSRNLNLQVEFPCAPCLKRTCTYKGEHSVEPPCFGSLPPELVWQRLEESLG